MEKKFLTRPEAADYLTNFGLPITKSTLQKMACVGGGPSYKIFGNRSVYRPDDLDNWVLRKLGPLRVSTSENVISADSESTKYAARNVQLSKLSHKS